MDARSTYHPAMRVANVACPIYTKLETRHSQTHIGYMSYQDMIQTETSLQFLSYRFILLCCRKK